MKMKKLLAIVLSAAMVTTSITVPTGPGDIVMAATDYSASNGDTTIDVIKSTGNGWWNAANAATPELASTFPASGKSVQYIFTAASADCGLFLESSTGGDSNVYLSMNAANDAWGDAATDYQYSDDGTTFSSEKKEMIFTADHTYTVTLSNESGTIQLELIDLDNTSVKHYMKCTLAREDLVGKALTWTAQAGTFYTAKSSDQKHTYNKTVTVATCTAAGKTTYACSDEGCNYSYSYTQDALGHKFSGEAKYYSTKADAEAGGNTVNVSEISCTSSVFKAQYCENEKKNVVEEISGMKHTVGAQVSAKSPTAAENGNVAYYPCTECQKNFADSAGTKEISNITVPKLLHTSLPSGWYAEDSSVCPMPFPKEGETAQYIFTCSDVPAGHVGGDVVFRVRNNTSEIRLNSNGDATSSWNGGNDSITITKTGNTDFDQILKNHIFSAEYTYSSGTLTVVVRDLTANTEYAKYTVALGTFDVETAQLYFWPMYGEYDITYVSASPAVYNLSKTQTVEWNCLQDGMDVYSAPDNSLIYNHITKAKTGAHTPGDNATYTNNKGETVDYSTIKCNETVYATSTCAACGANLDHQPVKGKVHTISTAKTEAKAPTATEDGNVAYYGCTKGDAYFADTEGKKEISNVTMPKLLHTSLPSGWFVEDSSVCPMSFPKEGETAQYIFTCSDVPDGHVGGDVVFRIRNNTSEIRLNSNGASDASWNGNNDSIIIAKTGNTDYDQILKNHVFSAEYMYSSGTLTVVVRDLTADKEFATYTVTLGTFDVENAQLYFWPMYGEYDVTCVSASPVTYNLLLTQDTATCTAGGTQTYKTTDGALIYEIASAAKGHTMTATAAKAATCTEPGNSAYWHCSACDLYYDNEAGTGTGAATTDSFVIAAKGHNYTDKFTWSEKDGGGYTASAVLTCANDASHTVNLTANVTSETTKATYENEGKTVYTATATHEGKNYTDTKTDIIPKLTDNVKPNASVTLGTNVWKELLNTITFGLLFKETQTVTVEASDAGIGLDSVSYILASKQMTSDQLAADAAAWTAFESFTGTATVSLNPSKKYVVYVKAVDKAGNVTYVSSDGVIVDDTAPVIEGVEDGKTYCKAQTITVTDNLELKSVTVNGTAVTLDENQYTISPADGTQTIVATDTVGNSTTIAITVNNGHEYDNPEFSWTENAEGNNFTAKAFFVCKHCDDKQEVTATVERTSTTATCTEDGTTTYTATVSFGGKNYTDTKDAPSKALGHDYEEESSDATCTTPGTVIYTCKRCGYTETKSGVKLSHKLTKTEKKNPTCTEAGTEEYWTCTECHNLFSDDSGKDESMTTLDALAIPATGHAYDSVKFTWSEDKTTATAVAVCANDASHTEEIADVTMTQKDTAPASCTDDGERIYTAAVSYGGKDYTESKTVAIPAAGHDYEAVFTWTDDNKCSAVLKCRKNDSTIAADQLSCTVGEPTVTPAACETAGATTYTATVTYNGKTYTDQKIISIPATGHKYDSVKFTWSEDKTTATAAAVCTNDPNHTIDMEVTMSHTTTKEPDCTTAGTETYTAAVTYEGREYSDSKEVRLNALGHDYEETVTEPTCGKEGYTTYTCKRCHESYVGNKQPATGKHSYKSTVTEAATYKTEGIQTFTCSVCGDSYTRAIARKTLAKPSVSSAANVSNGVKVTWKKVTGAEGYYVLRRTGSGKWSRIATVKKASTLNYTDKKASNGKTYSYTVQAYAGTNTSAYGTAGKTTVYLSKVTLSKLTNKKGKKLVAQYKKNTKASGYVIQYSTSKKFKSAKKVTVKSAKTLSATLKSLKKKKTYYVRVCAYKKSGKKTYYSEWGNVKSKKVTK